VSWANNWYQSLIQEMGKIGDGSNAAAGGDDDNKLVV
jgi:hypothetical protein